MSDPVDTELINKVTELQQEAKEHLYAHSVSLCLFTFFQTRPGCIQIG